VLNNTLSCIVCTNEKGLWEFNNSDYSYSECYVYSGGGTHEHRCVTGGMKMGMI
jgi:hypothetical protein